MKGVVNVERQSPAVQVVVSGEMADLPVRRVLRALERAGFVLVRQRGSHRVVPASSSTIAQEPKTTVLVIRFY